MPKKLIILLLWFVSLTALTSFGQQQEPNWFRSERGRFSVRIPGSNIVETSPPDRYPLSGSITSDLGNMSFGVAYVCYCEGGADKVTRQKLDEVEKGIKSKPDHKIVGEHEITIEAKIGRTLKTYPGREIRVETKTSFITYRVYATGDVVYQVLVASAKTIPNPQEGDMFFSSFRLDYPFDGQDKSESNQSNDKNGLVGKSEEVIGGNAIHLEIPTYPFRARNDRVEGRVQVEITIDETGKVESAIPRCGHPDLVPAAVAAARACRFRPSLRGGTPFKVVGILTFHFNLR